MARKVMGLWRLDNGGIQYHCKRCDAKDRVYPERGERRPPDPDQLEAIRAESAKRKAAEVKRRRQIVDHLWKKSRPVAGTPGEIYWRKTRGITAPLPWRMRFIPSTDEHAAAILIPFGFEGPPVGLHVTHITDDGAKIDKKMIGKDTVGLPLVLATKCGAGELAITEGPEDAMTLHQLLTCAAWAAGSKDRLPLLAEAVPTSVAAVWVQPDFDRDGGGLQKAGELVLALKGRGIYAHLLGVKP